MRYVMAAAAVLALAAAPAKAELLLKRVLISTGGVGYFEHEAEVEGAAALALRVRLDQVDDVLKSLVVFDDRGGVGTISLPGREPLEDVFRELPFDQRALETPRALLSALRGVEVEVDGPRQLSGRVLSVEREETRGEDGVAARHRVTLMTSLGLRQFLLEEVDGLRFLDRALDGQLRAALEALARHGERERRVVEVRTTGEGRRILRVGYLAEAPLWKAAYRVTLGEGDSADLQGFAVLENRSGEDWRDVELTIVSGHPVTFRQALYETYYVDRPEVPVEVLGRILPRVDEGARDIMPPAPRAALDPPRAELMMAERALAPERPAAIEAAEATEIPTQVVFRLPSPVSVESGHSLMVPIIDRALPAERLSLYQPETHERHPLASLRLQNDGESALPPGVLTLFERTAHGVAHVGDARLSSMPAGDERLISYAVDQELRIDRESEQSERIARGRIVDGVLEITVRERETARFAVTSAARDPRVILIEHPRRPGFELERADGSVEVAGERYRMRATIEPGASAVVSLAQSRPLLRRYELLRLDDDQIAFFATSAELSGPIRAAMAEIGHLRAAVAEQERARERLRRDSQAIVDDQARLRANLQAVPRDSDLYRRYLAELSAQEDRLGGVRSGLASTEEALAEAQAALRDYVRGLAL